MSNPIPRLPDAELEIMKIIWESNGECTSAYIFEKLQGKKDWVLTTILNFLARLTDRGFLTTRKVGKANIYKPIIDEAAYLESESISFLERLHGNSFKSLVSALYSGNAISQEDLQELQHYIDEKAKG